MKLLLITICAFAFASADVSLQLQKYGADYDTEVSSGIRNTASAGSYAHSAANSASHATSTGTRTGSSYGGSSAGSNAFSNGGGYQSPGVLETGPSGFLDYSSGAGNVAVGKIIKPVIKTGAPIVSKSFYLHEINVDSPIEVDVEEREHVVRPRKHYNIVFVKAPVAGSSLVNSNNVNVFPENEEKTIVYVLTGRNDGVEVNENGEIQLPQPKTPSKPEVVFVKYNNEADAQRAISDIQNQYNNQQGATVSVIGAGNVAPARGSVSATSSATASATATSSSYTHTSEDKEIRSVQYKREIPISTATVLHHKLSRK